MLRKLFLTSAFCLAALSAEAHDYNLGDLKIVHPWSRATPAQAPTGAAFMTIINNGATDRLLKAASDAAKVTELHTHIMDGQVMRMRQVQDIDVAGGAETKFQPGGLHVMLIGLKAPLKEGATFPLTLTFEKAGTVTVEVTVQGIADKSPSHDGGGMPGVQHKGH